MTEEAVYGTTPFCPKCGHGAMFQQPIRIALKPIRYEVDGARDEQDHRGLWTVKCSSCDWEGIGQKTIERPRVMGLF